VTRVYADHAATGPMLPAARAAWLEQSENIGNPSSLHAAGRRSRRVLEESRERIAAALHVRPSAVIFTSGGTEADNLAIKGLFWARSGSHAARTGIMASAIEHHAVLDPVSWLADEHQAKVTWLGVDSRGFVDLDSLTTVLAEQASTLALATVMWANNEIGTIQPIAKIAEHMRAAGIPFHTDAVQALGHVPMDLGSMADSGPDAVTITSHKIGGPFGIGALIADPSLALTPLLHGGGQERDVRSGTFDAAAAAGFAVAVEYAVTQQQEHAQSLITLRDALMAGIAEAVPDAIINGDRSERLPGNVHVSFPGCEGDALLMLLDAAGIDCSTGSACTAGVPEPSHVLLAMGVPESVARSSLRFSLGRTSTREDVARIVAALPAAVSRAQRAGAVRGR
jgi:cysteine desulfurase